MLNACDTSPFVIGVQDDYRDVNVSHWDSVKPASSTSRTSLDSNLQNGFRRSIFPGAAGLRSRKASSHRRSSTGALSSHPLQEPSIPTSSNSNSTTDSTITRPLLRRWLTNEGVLDDVVPVTLDDAVRGSQQVSINEAEILAIVHEVNLYALMQKVSRTDSLAGVALKYGIGLADLRRVNQLWASDTIHLRKTLYIPLHLTNMKRRHADVYGNNLLDCAEISEVATISQRSSPVIQRIPVSQLSFFPPSSQTPRVSHDIMKREPKGHSSPRIRSTASAPQVLSSLLQSLPFSSRDTLFPRLSIDSSESSSIANPSETSSDQEHEMDILGLSRRQDQMPTDITFFYDTSRVHSAV
ncbi:hypothetical protein EW145_g5696 [Phellinidium pouzarii]|uniref:LysM domain-containing protein n=1 Tax=Phellinidium pouzarii TaxID=167371 RepID=A0A4V3XC26_9AGAM|nr:hypothetical protein EW145_g5696 [Phellinidium pouzarii]